MLTAQNSVWVPFSISCTEANGGGFFGYAGENVQAMPPSTIVFPSPSARVTTPSSGRADSTA